MIILVLFFSFFVQANSMQSAEDILTAEIANDYHLLTGRMPDQIEVRWRAAIASEQRCGDRTLLIVNMAEVEVFNEGRPISNMYIGGSAGPVHFFFIHTPKGSRLAYRSNIISIIDGSGDCTSAYGWFHGIHFNRSGNLYGLKRIKFRGNKVRLEDL